MNIPPSALRVLQQLYSKPDADVLLCVGPDQGHHVVMKRFHIPSTKTESSSPTSADESLLLVDSEYTEAAQEAAFVRRLLQLPHHPNIVRYYSASKKPKEIVITMEHCERGDLLMWLEQQPSNCFPEPQALAIFRQILSGVCFLHRNHIAHRDLSLENCLVSQDYTVKICDFELSTSASDLSRQRVGKLNYMAPEVARGDLYDPKQADVWALGIVLFMLLTGSPLYHVANKDDKVFRYAQRIGISGVLKQWGVQVSQRTIDLTSAMLSVNLECRLRNGEEIETMMQLP